MSDHGARYMWIPWAAAGLWAGGVRWAAAASVEGRSAPPKASFLPLFCLLTVPPPPAPHTPTPTPTPPPPPHHPHPHPPPAQAGGAAPGMADMMAGMDMSPDKMKAQFDALGMTPDQFIQKV